LGKGWIYYGEDRIYRGWIFYGEDRIYFSEAGYIMVRTVYIVQRMDI
jgi:hypothetical protein